MPLSAVALALGAAFLHAGWNVLLAGARDTRASTAGLLIWGVALLAVPALVTGGVSSDAIPYVAASAAFELCYFVLLARAYDGGEVSVVYPIARGSAPVVVLVFSAIALNEGVPAGAVVGVLSVALGVLLVGCGVFGVGLATAKRTPPTGELVGGGGGGGVFCVWGPKPQPPHPSGMCGLGLRLGP